MEKIIEKLVENLTTQRAALIKEAGALDLNSMNYHSKNQNIKDHISEIDMQINGHLTTLSNFK